MAICQVCNHDHDEEGNCPCGCEAEQEVDQLCWSCGHEIHGRECKCGCPG